MQILEVWCGVANSTTNQCVVGNSRAWRWSALPIANGTVRSLCPPEAAGRRLFQRWLAPPEPVGGIRRLPALLCFDVSDWAGPPNAIPGNRLFDRDTASAVVPRSTSVTAGRWARCPYKIPDHWRSEERARCPGTAREGNPNHGKTPPGQGLAARLKAVQKGLVLPEFTSQVRTTTNAAVRRKAVWRGIRSPSRRATTAGTSVSGRSKPRRRLLRGTRRALTRRGPARGRSIVVHAPRNFALLAKQDCSSSRRQYENCNHRRAASMGGRGGEDSVPSRSALPRP